MTRSEARDPVDRREVVGWLLACALLVVIRLRLLDVPLERDEGCFGVIGRAIVDGAVPYRDIFDHKPPGVFYVYALAIAVSPATTRGLHAFLAIWCVATATVVALLARCMAGRTAGLWAAFLFAVLSAAPSIQGFSASSEMLLMLPLTAAVLLGLMACRADTVRSSVLVFASGVLAGIACWIKPPVALPLAVVPIQLARDLGQPMWRKVLLWMAGAFGVTLAVLPLVAAAGWSEFWYWTVVHSSLYAAVPATARWARLAASLANVATDMGHVIVVGLIGAIVAWRRGRPRAAFALGFLLLSIASAFHSQFLYRHYFALIVPAVAAVGGAGLAWLGDAWLHGASARSRVVATTAAVLIALGLPLTTRPGYWIRPEPVAIIRETLGDQGFEAAPMLAAYISERTRPDERIFVYGSEPEIAFLSGRRDVNPFVMIYPMTWHWPRHREFQERLWSAIEREPPAFLVLPRTTFSLVRSPQMDPFLETKLQELGSREYRLDAVLVRDRDGEFRLRADAGEPGTEVFCELWRRRSMPAR